MSIRLLITGGTIDKTYAPLTGELGFSDSHLPAMLHQARSTIVVKPERLMMKDSLEMGDEDRASILNACRQCQDDQILISHGTDTLVETASLLGAAGLNRTIVLFGAMVPWTIGESDALFNLGAAMTAVQILGPGVYVAMSGQVFDWDKVEKDRRAGVFRAVLPGSAG